MGADVLVTDIEFLKFLNKRGAINLGKISKIVLMDAEHHTQEQLQLVLSLHR